jgi:Na+-driven multidrug efflux pump
LEKQNKFVKDMTKGNPMQLLIQFSLPLLVGNIFQQLYNMVDSIIVGNFVGANALGAIGTTNSLNFFFFSLGLFTGFWITHDPMKIVICIGCDITAYCLFFK